MTSRRVLLVEDEALILLDMESALADCGYQVDAVTTGQAALSLLDAHSFDAAVIDVSLRSGSSFGVADALLQRAIPFAFSTGSTERIPSAFAGIPVMEKPFQSVELVSLIGSLLAPK